MNLVWADEAVELGKVVESAIRDLGGIELARRAEADPAVRSSLVAPALDELGLWDIDVAADPVEIEAAALACQAAGRFGLPHPVAERLARPRWAEVDALAFVDPARPRAGMVDLGLRWLAVDPRGATAPVTGARRVPTRLGGFVCELAVVAPSEWSEPDDAGRRALATLLTLSAWTLLGTLEGAVELTREHVVGREQFGKPLASFQAVQFQLADAFVAVQGLRELARYALASIEADRGEALVDAVALRSCAQETAETVLRTAHQLHGATGFCDETGLSWLSRASHPARYLPFGHADTERWLTELVESEGFAGLFANGGR
jgi:3-oxo-4-pregnene-20-carboxyl-CoA dehydrogenase alpha subunit